MMILGVFESFEWHTWLLSGKIYFIYCLDLWERRESKSKSSVKSWIPPDKQNQHHENAISSKQCNETTKDFGEIRISLFIISIYYNRLAI